MWILTRGDTIARFSITPDPPCPQSMANLEAAMIISAICARFDLALAPEQVRAACVWVRKGQFEGDSLMTSVATFRPLCTSKYQFIFLFTPQLSLCIGPSNMWCSREEIERSDC